MTDRERLIEILKKPIYPKIGVDPAEVVADYLLEKGVIVAPMPMAEWLRQELTEYVRKRCFEEL